jgi:hypothetical protein
LLIGDLDFDKSAQLLDPDLWQLRAETFDVAICTAAP